MSTDLVDKTRAEIDSAQKNVILLQMQLSFGVIDRHKIDTPGLHLISWMRAIEKNICWFEIPAITFAPVLLKTTYQERQRDMAL